jgi:MarR family transcriptional regulator, transcriptional regulator for hemolysin
MPARGGIADSIACVILLDAIKASRAIESDFLFLIYDVAQLMRRRADKQARTYGMTRAQWAVLVRLEREPGITQSQLAALTDVEPITIGRLVDRLEASRLIARLPDPKDRRIWRLRLTAKSATVLKQIATFRAELHIDMADGLDVRSLETLVRSLQRMRSNLTTGKKTRRRKVSAG